MFLVVVDIDNNSFLDAINAYQNIQFVDLFVDLT